MGYNEFRNSGTKKALHPLSIGTRTTRGTTQFNQHNANSLLEDNGSGAGTNLLLFSLAAQGWIHSCFHRLAPPVGSLKKNVAATTSLHRLTYEITITLLYARTFGKQRIKAYSQHYYALNYSTLY